MQCPNLKITADDGDAVISHFSLTYNTVYNMDAV